MLKMGVISDMLNSKDGANNNMNNNNIIERFLTLKRQVDDIKLEIDEICKILGV